MIAHKVKRRHGTRSSYVRLVRYLLDPKDTLERVGHVAVTNCYSNEATLAALEVQATQQLNQRSKDDKTYHLLISFREGESPSQDVLVDCEREYCQALGFAEHQRVSVVHHDTGNVHLHVAINKIHPTRFTIQTPKNDYWVLGETSKKLELRHQLLRDRHDRRDPADGPTGAAAAMERHAGTESLVGWIQRNAADELRRATTWDELHRVAQGHGLEVRLRGAGCVIAQGELVVRASAVRRDFALGALQKKLGPFEPARELGAVAQHEREQAREQGPAAAAPPPPHLRGKHELLADALGQEQPVLQPDAPRVSSVDEASQLQSRHPAESSEHLACEVEEQQRRMQQLAELVRELARSVQAPPVQSKRRKAHRAPPRAPRMRGASGERGDAALPPPQARHRHIDQLEQQVVSMSAAAAITLEEQQRRMDAWAQLLDDLTRKEQAQNEWRARAARARESREPASGARMLPRSASRPGKRSVPPPPLRARRRNLEQLQQSPESQQLNAAITAEEQLRRMDAWAELIEQLRRDERAKRGVAARSSARAARPVETGRPSTYRVRPLTPQGPARKLYQLYLREQAAAAATRRERGAQLRVEGRAEFERVVLRWRRRRAALRLVPGTQAEKRFMYAAARFAMQQELKAVRARATDDRRILARETKRLAWVEWLRGRASSGDAAALDVLRSRRASSAAAATGQQRAIAGQPLPGRARLAKGAVDTITKTGVVIYRGALTGVRDEGHQLRVAGSVPAAVLAEALRVAANRYGAALRVEGDDAFKQAVVDVAVARRLKITFDDPELEARRRAQPLKETDRERAPTDQGHTESGQADPAAAATGPEASRPDRMRDVRLGELVRDGQRAELLLPQDVPAHLARRDRQGRQDLRRAAGAPRGRLKAEPPPGRRGALRSLATLGTLPVHTHAGPRQTGASAPARGVRRSADPARRRAPPNAPARARAVDGDRPLAPRAAVPALGASLPGRPVRSRTGQSAQAAITRYVAEREAKRGSGIADVLPHRPFAGQAGEFTFVGRRNVDGHELLLVRDAKQIFVVGAKEPPRALRSGDRVTLGDDGQVIGHSRGRAR